ncbi:hybrid-cluster NAD(P)-dependent oxidoreductase [Solimicrobium silvestre]|uniref:Oxidoreductase FAD-binding domain n=1 Tax=Solimicrobium silvestre TaxID=2099400 RepID=A0A2S9GWA1_9BURK|nr:hybrid-cluster NAD(P)-dependent oxidoreductase [Solimicrobium silvestre]PRC91990.1 Oxidoreductase FAD-binding domain [Solimicrobium silvestre]
MLISLTHQFNAAPVLWNGDSDDTLICREIRQETADVKTFVLGSPQPRLFRYAPGQFITLELDIAGQTINRCYTLSSTPTRPDQVSITVKRVPGGIVSNWLHDNLTVGSNLRVLGPAGEFSCFLHPMPPKQKYLFLSAGSGITPLMSMARAAHDLVLDANIVFMHSARTPGDIIFARELELMAFNRPQFQLGLVCERRGNQPMWAGFNGFLTHAILHNVAPDFMDRHVYTCGPAPYMAAVRALLQTAGFTMANYHEESFSFETLQADQADIGALLNLPELAQSETAIALTSHVSTSQFNIEFTRTGYQVACSADQTILSAARAAGLRLPTSCTQGLCGTCKTKMVSGQVEMKHAGGIRQREIDQGWILPCCSKPLSDVVLEK